MSPGTARACAFGFAVLGISLGASTASAFDGSRRGFILGIGAGGGATSIEDQDGGEIRNLGSGGLATDFEIGGARSERLLVYYANRVVWLSDRDRLGVSGLGLRRYLGDAGAFGDVTLGLSSWTGRLGDTIGLGASLAFGWEARDHWLVRGALLYGDSGLREDYLKPRGTAGTLTVVWLGY